MRHLLFAVIVAVTCTTSLGREWRDASGSYEVVADMVAHDETMVVLERADKELVSIAISQLSKADQDYVKEQAAKDQNANSDLQEWTLTNGLKVRAAVVEYGQREINVRRRFGKVYANDKPFDNLPGVYKRMLPRIISHFEKGIDLQTEKELKKWAEGLRGKAKTYTVDGVMLRLENGDIYGVPFFFFSKQDLKVLQPGWDQWLALKNDNEQREQQSLYLRARSTAVQRQRSTDRRIAMLQLHLQGYDAGLFDLWEVAMYPPPNVRGIPVRVVVPGRNNQQAAANAIAKYPNYRVGAIAKVERRR